jgi:DNA adenine methylase
MESTVIESRLAELDRYPSPLTYPGGKSRAIPILVPLIMDGLKKANTNELVSPFIGGGNVEIACAQLGAQVHGSDAFRQLVNFWTQLERSPVALAKAVQKYLTANVNDNDRDFKELQKLIPQMPDGIEQAAAFYVVNKLSIYGMGLSGNRSPDARISWNGVNRIAEFSSPGLSVQCRDYRDALRAHPSAFAYLDPPYEFLGDKRNCFYGIDGDGHRGFDHDALFREVEHRPNWMMSYNADEHVLARYAGFPMAFPKWAYGMTASRESNEVLIFSKDRADLAEVARERIAAAESEKADGRYSPANDRSSGADAWKSPDLSLLSEASIPAPPFPNEVLGDDWSHWCREVARAANSPYDYVAMSLVTAAAGLIGNSLTVRATGTFVQPAIIWNCNVGKSGSGKTPAMDVVSDIVDTLDSQAAERQRLRQVTVAASVKLASENAKGLLVFRDELPSLWTEAKKPGGEEFWLEAYNGKPFSKDRESRDPVFIEKLAVSVIGGAQPDTVKQVTTDGKNRGFSARYIFTYPEPVDTYEGDDVRIDRVWATAALGRLKNLKVATACIPLSPDGQLIFRNWWNAKKREIAEHDGLWAEWMQKQGGNALRLALCLEMLKWCGAAKDSLPAEIATQTLHDALNLIDSWAIPMAQRTLDVMYRPREEQWASMLARHLRRENLSAFNARGFYRGEYGPAGPLRNAETLDKACMVLIRSGLIRDVGVRRHPRKGRTSSDYAVNPALLARK